MQDYYQEMAEEIEQLLKEEKYDEADVIVKREMKMPYIPSDFEKILKRAAREIRFHQAEKERTRVLSPEEIFEKLNSADPDLQLMAAEKLSSINLREYTEELQNYFQNSPAEEAAALAIECIAEQEINDEFEYVKDGVEYSFYGDTVTPVSKSKGYISAESLLNEWLQNDHPDLLHLCRMSLVHDCFMYLPLSYEEEEAEALALAQVKNITSMMGMESVYEDLLKQLENEKPGLLS